MYRGDFAAGSTVSFRFNTHQTTGSPITLAGSPTLAVYKSGSTTESTAGVTLTVDYDGRTGLHDIAINTAADGTFYATGNDFDVVITAGTVDSVSVAGMLVGSFSLANRSRVVNVTQWRGSPVATNPVSGVPIVDVGYVNGSAATASAAAVPADLVSVNGTTFAGANAPSNLQLVKGQTVTATAGVIFPTTAIGTSTFAGGPVASVTAPVTAGSVTGPVTLATVQPSYAPAKAGDAMTLTLTQAIPDVKTATVGGALNGSWAVAWGRVVKDVIAKTLGVWGAGNATGTASETFDLDDGTNPTTRTPR